MQFPQAYRFGCAFPTIDSNIAAGWQHRRRWISILTREWARRSAFTFGISCAWKRPHRRTVSQVLQSDVLRVWEKLLPRFFQNPRLRYSLCTGKAGYVFFGQYAAATVSFAYGKTSYLRIESARYTTVSLVYGKTSSVDAVRFPSQEFPFQRPLPCIARSCIVSAGV